MTPAARVGLLLAEARRAGVPFATAWPDAITGALAAARAGERADWHAALIATRYAWEAAWERRPPTPAQRALRVIASGRERVTDDDPQRCALCDKPFTPAPRAAPAKYCSTPCRKRAFARRHAAA